MNQTPAKSSTAPPYASEAWFTPSKALDGLAPIDHLFNRLDGLYPQRWRGNFKNDQSVTNWREAWVEGLVEEQINPSEVKRGLEHCRKYLAWPPSFAEFLSACRPPIDPEAAYHEALEQLRRRKDGNDNWSHQAIFWTAIEIGEFDLKISNWQSMQSRWTSKLKSTLEKRDLPEIPPRREALPEPGQTTPDRERVTRHIDALKAKLSMGKTN